MVLTRSRVTMLPARSDLDIASAPDGSTPMTLIPGFWDFSYSAMPPINPPPPIGTRTVWKSSRSASSSKAIFPCPATTSASSYAWTKVAPLSFCAASASTYAPL